MSIAQTMLPEYDQEVANTRKMLEAIPDDKLDYKPHEKGWKLASLVTHLVTIPEWGKDTLTTDSYDFSGYAPPQEVTSSRDAIDRFDKNAAAARAALASVSDEALHRNWTLSGNGQVFFTMPRIAVLRGFVMNHLIHHRAQLGVYLRLLGAKVPGMYGPSADEPM